MSIVGIGTDIVEVGRVKGVLDRFDRFQQRLFTEGEIAYCNSRPHPHLHFAARFAAKEAVIKALGGGRKGYRWRDVEILRDRGSRPRVALHGVAAKIAEHNGITDFHLSLSHTGSAATAFAIAVGVPGTLASSAEGAALAMERDDL